MNKPRQLKTGIEHHPEDSVQPWTVWYQGTIVWFARTMAEATEKLKEQRLRVREKE